MQLIRQAADLETAGHKVCLAIGVFDGVHLGHQQIIRQTLTDARQHEGLALIVTFDRHPAAVVAPQSAPALIYPLSQKLRVIESLGADGVLLIEFNQAFSEQSGEQFIRNLCRDLGRVQSICVGADFVFGHKRSGNVELLRQLGAELNFHVHGMAALALDGAVVSSTRIRNAIQSGNLDDASQMLGRSYSVAGRIIHGDHLGRQLGFPTANLDVSNLVLPPDGVYAARATIDAKTHRAVLNIGVRPTVATPTVERRFEVHLLDFSSDVAGREMEVEFVARLREEKKFASLDALKAQIAADVLAARACF